MAAVIFASDIFVELLKLNPRQKKHVLPCCFHPDTQPSLAIDLVKGVWYCHGSCSKPKGGGPVSFLMQWEKIKNGKTISPREARQRLRSTFNIPSVSEVKRQMRLAEIRRFADLVIREGANVLRSIDQSLAKLTAAGLLRPLSEDEWELLGILHEERRFWDELWTTCHGENNPLRLEGVLREARVLGLWSGELYFALQLQDARRAEYERSRDYARLQQIKLDALQWAVNETTKRYEGYVCHASQYVISKKVTVNKTPVPKRMPVPTKTPVH